jgi:dihydropyrimidinase
MVSKGRGGPEALARLTAEAPAQLYGLPGKGALAPGMDADIVIWDPEKTMTYGADDLHDNVGYNPWEGYSVTGWPTHVFQRGALLVENGDFHGTPGTGRWINRPALTIRTHGPKT